MKMSLVLRVCYPYKIFWHNYDTIEKHKDSPNFLDFIPTGKFPQYSLLYLREFTWNQTYRPHGGWRGKVRDYQTSRNHQLETMYVCTKCHDYWNTSNWQKQCCQLGKLIWGSVVKLNLIQSVAYWCFGLVNPTFQPKAFRTWDTKISFWTFKASARTRLRLG